MRRADHGHDRGLARRAFRMYAWLADLRTKVARLGAADRD